MLSWLSSLLRPDNGVLDAIFIAASAGEPMHAVESVTAIVDRGLEGDRYATQTGFWQATDSCAVTLITDDDLKHARRRTRLDLESGAHRRNLVISGIKAQKLEGKTWRIGTALFQYHKPRPPCGYLDRIAGRGMARALGRHSGICIRVIESGVLKVGDRVEIITPPPP
jgi:MOSC domain-containing protein YiiM